MRLTWFEKINWVQLFGFFKQSISRAILLFWQYLSAVGFVVIWLWILSGTKNVILETILFLGFVIFLTVVLSVLSVIVVTSLVNWYRKYVASKK